MDNENPIPFSDRFWGFVTRNNVIYPRFKVIDGGLLTYSKIRAQATFSSQVVEDQTLPVLATGRKQITEALSWKIDQVILHGMPPASEIHIEEGFRGLRHTDKPTIVVAVKGPLTLTTARDAQKQLDFESFDQLAWIISRPTESQLHTEPEFVPIRRSGPLANPEPGRIGHLDGVPVFVSDVFPLADEAISLCVVMNRWVIDRQRHVAVETDYSPLHDRYHLTATVLLAFGHIRDVMIPYV